MDTGGTLLILALLALVMVELREANGKPTALWNVGAFLAGTMSIVFNVADMLS